MNPRFFVYLTTFGTQAISPDRFHTFHEALLFAKALNRGRRPLVDGRWRVGCEAKPA